MTREDVDALMGHDVVRKIEDRTLPFTAEGFLMSFSPAELLFPRDHGLARVLRHKGGAAPQARFYAGGRC